MFEKIMVPLDGSRYSTRALPYAIEIAKKFNGEIILLQVVSPTPVTVPAVGGYGMTSPVATELFVESARNQDKRNISRAKSYLRRKLKGVAESGVRTTFEVLPGDPAEVIIEFGHKESIGLVVMTTSGKSGLKRAFVGSVADKVVREPGIPVLAIRPKNPVPKKTKPPQT